MTGDVGLALPIWMCPCGNNVHHPGHGSQTKILVLPLIFGHLLLQLQCCNRILWRLVFCW